MLCIIVANDGRDLDESKKSLERDSEQHRQHMHAPCERWV